MKKSYKKKILMVLFVIFILNAVQIYAFNNIKKGDKAIPFTVSKLEGVSFSLDTLLTKKTIVLFFWKLDLTRMLKPGESSGKGSDAGSKWIQEMTFLQKMNDNYKSNGLEIIGIVAPVKSIFDKQNNMVKNPEFTPEEISDIKKYLAENNINFSMVLDEGLKIYSAYGIVPFPSTAIINMEGIMTYEIASFPTYGGETVMEENIKIALGLIKQEAKAPAVAQQKYIPKGQAEKYYKNAVQLREKDKIDKALEELKLAVKEDPAYSDPHEILAQIYKDKKDNENAMLEYITLIELEPTNPLNHVKYADFSLENGMIDDAKKEYEMAIVSDTTGLSYVGRGGELKIKIRKIASGDAYYGLGMVSLKEKKKDEALEFFAKAIGFFKGTTADGDMISEMAKKKEIHPNLPRVYYEIGMIYLEKGEEDKAINEFKQGIESYQDILKKILK